MVDDTSAELHCFIISFNEFFSIALRLDVSNLSTCEHCRLYSTVCFKMYHTLFSELFGVILRNERSSDKQNNLPVC